MQRLYRLWKSRLHYYYKSVNCGKTDAERLKNPPPDVSQDQWAKCVKRFGSKEFKVLNIEILILIFPILHLSFLYLPFSCRQSVKETLKIVCLVIDVPIRLEIYLSLKLKIHWQDCYGFHYLSTFTFT